MYLKTIAIRSLGIERLMAKAKVVEKLGKAIGPGDSYPPPVVVIKGAKVTLLTDESVVVALAAGGATHVDCAVREAADDTPMLPQSGRGQPRARLADIKNQGTPRDLETFGMAIDEEWEAHVACVARWLFTARKTLAAARRDVLYVHHCPASSPVSAELLKKIDELGQLISGAVPRALCPACKGLPLTCTLCDGSRWVSKAQFEELKATDPDFAKLTNAGAMLVRKDGKLMPYGDAQ